MHQHARTDVGFREYLDTGLVEVDPAGVAEVVDATNGLAIEKQQSEAQPTVAERNRQHEVMEFAPLRTREGPWHALLGPSGLVQVHQGLERRGQFRRFLDQSVAAPGSFEIAAAAPDLVTQVRSESAEELI